MINVEKALFNWARKADDKNDQYTNVSLYRVYIYLYICIKLSIKYLNNNYDFIFIG